MENWENQNFESEWKEAFDGAELSPSSNLWDSIDLRIVHQENVTMKRRVIFYQRLAAASVGIMLLVGGYAFLRPNFFKGTSLAQNDPTRLIQVDSTASLAKNGEVSAPRNSTDENGKGESNNGKSGVVEKGVDENRNSESNSVQKAENGDRKIIEKDRKQNNMDSGITFKTANGVDNSGNGLAEQSVIPVADSNGEPVAMASNSMAATGKVAKVVPIPLSDMPEIFVPNDYTIAYRLADLTPAKRSKKKSNFQSENSWASVGFAAGTFAPGAGGRQLNQAANLNNAFAYKASNTLGAQRATPAAPLSNEKINQGTSFSFLVSVGKRVFKRMVLLGGLNYLNQQSTSTASSIEVFPANQLAMASAVADSYSLQSTNAVTYATSNEINSTFQFITLPIQTGYILVDKKIGIQINGGFSPDFFLKSVVYDQATKTGSVNSGSSNQSFTRVSLSGIGGIELSYKFLKHYSISLVPGFRYSLTPVYKEPSLASAKPLVTDLGLRFRYSFDN